MKRRSFITALLASPVLAWLPWGRWGPGRCGAKFTEHMACPLPAGHAGWHDNGVVSWRPDRVFFNGGEAPEEERDAAEAMEKYRRDGKIRHAVKVYPFAHGGKS
jgi:hypothetical protein